MATERTLSIIKPDATRRNITGAIVARFEEAGLRARQQSLEVLDICIRHLERFQVPNALVEAGKDRELAAEGILPKVELEDAFHFVSIVPPVRIGHGDLVKVRQERADQWVGWLARCHGCHIWSLRRRRATNPPWLSGGRELAWAVRR